jgi:phosphoribosyl 1,2-cyclic phosphate phosphodiesterase
MTKIKFIGTGSLEGTPSPLCDCQVCNLARKNDSKDKRLRSSIFLEFNDGNSLIIDCSPDFRKQLEKFKFPIENIFITHGHFDHFFGLGELSYLNNLYKKSPNIYGRTDVIDYCKHIFGYLNLGFRPLNENKFKIGKNEISLIEVVHAKNTSTTGILFNKILILPEIYKIDPETKKTLKNSEIDLLIVDGAYYGEAVYKDHFTIQEAIRFGKDVGAKRTIVTNIWHRTKPFNKLKEEFSEFAEIAYDGMEINL